MVYHHVGTALLYTNGEPHNHIEYNSILNSNPPPANVAISNLNVQVRVGFIIQACEFLFKRKRCTSIILKGFQGFFIYVGCKFNCIRLNLMLIVSSEPSCLVTKDRVQCLLIGFLCINSSTSHLTQTINPTLPSSQRRLDSSHHISEPC